MKSESETNAERVAEGATNATRAEDANAPRESKALVRTEGVVRLSMDTVQGFEALQRAAKLFASSTIVPEVYRGNLGNCVIALNMAAGIGADPLMVMQNLYIVHGTPGWSAKFSIAAVNQCGRFSALRYEWRGKKGEEAYGCRAWAIEKATGQRLDGAWIDLKMVKGEGWSEKKGSKWLTMEEQMFFYRAAAFWTRAYAPELLMGLHTREELEDSVIPMRAGPAGSWVAPSMAGEAPVVAGVIPVEGQATPAQTNAPGGTYDSMSTEDKAMEWIGTLHRLNKGDATELAQLQGMLLRKHPEDADPVRVLVDPAVAKTKKRIL